MNKLVQIKKYIIMFLLIIVLAFTINSNIEVKALDDIYDNETEEVKDDTIKINWENVLIYSGAALGGIIFASIVYLINKPKIMKQNGANANANANANEEKENINDNF